MYGFEPTCSPAAPNTCLEDFKFESRVDIAPQQARALSLLRTLNIIMGLTRYQWLSAKRTVLLRAKLRLRPHTSGPHVSTNYWGQSAAAPAQ